MAVTRVLAARCHTHLGHSPTGKVDVMNPVRRIVIAAAAVAAMVVAAAAVPAGADPTPPPSPGYQILTPGGGSQFPGVQTYQPACLRNMRACGFEYDPATGTWNAPPPSE
jgi:hypothetical protein